MISLIIIAIADLFRLNSDVPIMDTIEHFSDFLNRIGAHNFLALGIAMIILWLLVSGLRKGLKKGGRDKEPPKNEGEMSEKNPL